MWPNVISICNTTYFTKFENKIQNLNSADNLKIKLHCINMGVHS